MINFQKNIPLESYSHYKIGGPTRLFAEAETTEELKEILKHPPCGEAGVQNDNEKIFILGGGTNVLIDDGGFGGLVIHNKIEGILRQSSGQGENLRVGSGTLIKDLLDFCIENSLTGAEWAGGLPGTIGGAVRGNAGAFKGETKDNVVEVESLNIETLEEKLRTNKECNFSYRNSVFKSGEGTCEFITHVVLGLTLGDKEEIKEKIQQKIDYRINRHPMNYPNIGSTFKNIPLNSLSEGLQKEFASFVKTDPFPVVPTTKLLALCDLKGKRVGGAMISDKHPNFIVNVDNASSEDVKALIEIAKQAVKEKYNLILEEEIVYLG